MAGILAETAANAVTITSLAHARGLSGAATPGGLAARPYVTILLTILFIKKEPPASSDIQTIR